MQLTGSRVRGIYQKDIPVFALSRLKKKEKGKAADDDDDSSTEDSMLSYHADSPEKQPKT